MPRFCPDCDGVEPQYAGVSYYHAVPASAVALATDPHEVSEAGRFALGELPAEVAPPASAPAVLAAWREALRAGRLETLLPDVG